jgi:hypothetical protein
LLILAVAGMQAASAVVTSSVLLKFLDGGEPTKGQIVSASLVGLATTGVGLLALIGWSAWLSKAVRTMPALGLGYPAANGLMAFVENFLPGLNLWRIPAIVRDIVRRLEPTEGRGEALIFAAWIGLLGGFFIPRIGGFLNAFAADTVNGYVWNQVVVQGVSTGLVLLGAIFLVVLIWWIEARIERRRMHQLAEGITAPTAPGALAALPAFASLVPHPEADAFAVAIAAPARAASPAPPTSPAPPASPATTATPVRAPIAGPLGTLPVQRQSDPVLERSITAATRAAAVPIQAPPPALPDEPEPPLPPPAAGPHLHLRIESAASMTATLDDESEPMTLKELRAAAAALARVEGSATITAAPSVEARARAQEVLEIMSTAGVPATLED